ncbi:cytosolic phospholipase A2 gamma-like isoform X2 [Megalobrama amblycephala]|uniref:cytosolic phospholipase A2 gamma-like isoform X2 n=1 Tax=Megalobrama amblycephala TaxID=75352 RepID=UPI0020142072|nr:cytosolic phospholipase A2 gamma-like isoform X2 [Megalobrama amblycephala]
MPIARRAQLPRSHRVGEQLGLGPPSLLAAIFFSYSCSAWFNPSQVIQWNAKRLNHILYFLVPTLLSDSFILACRLQPLSEKMSEENQSKSDSKVRIGHSLNEAEMNHVTSRRESALECLKKHGIQCSLDKLPNIALLASGGAERAMMGLLGSLVALFQDDLLDCMLYLVGLSGSTWCMASLYKEPNWSNKLETMKDDFAQRPEGGHIRFEDKISKLKKYYRQKDTFSLTDIWAVLVVSEIVNEIDESTFTSQRSRHSKDPYPIYTVIDMQSRFDKLEAEKFVEITPHETGYSITGAFVDTSCFGSHFDQGVKTQDQPEMDMLFLQGLCGSGLADLEKILEELLPLIKKLMLHELDVIGDHSSSEIKQTDVHSLSDPHVDEAGEVLLTLVELNLLVLRKEDPSSHIQILNNLLSEKLDKEQKEKLIIMSKEVNKKNIKEYTLYICSLHSCWNLTCCEIWTVIVKCIELVTHWIWGTTYNFLCNMTAEEVSPSILKEEKRHYVDAGIDNNSPFLPLLRKERHIDVILSLDFSETDPFKSLIKTVDMCKDLHIDFPEVPNDLDDERDDPKDFYVFEGPNAPTVIHIPLFNKTNCGDKEIGKWRKTYKTFQPPYDSKMIYDLLEKAEINIKNNKEKLLTEIQKVIKRKTS